MIRPDLGDHENLEFHLADLSTACFPYVRTSHQYYCVMVAWFSDFQKLKLFFPN